MGWRRRQALAGLALAGLALAGCGGGGANGSGTSTTRPPTSTTTHATATTIPVPAGLVGVAGATDAVKACGQVALLQQALGQTAPFPAAQAKPIADKVAADAQGAAAALESAWGTFAGHAATLDQEAAGPATWSPKVGPDALLAGVRAVESDCNAVNNGTVP